MNTKYQSFFEEHAERMKNIPGPNKYIKITNWNKKNIKGGNLNKSEHMSHTAEIMNRSKDSPGVGKYKWNKPFKIRGYSRQRSRKTTFIEEIEEVSRLIPGHKYKLNSSLLLKRAPNYSFRQIKKSKERTKLPKNMVRDENGIVKSIKVAPGYYKAEDSYRKTQAVYKNKLMFNKNKEKRYFDQLLDNKKHIPGVGEYKNLENAIKMSARPQTAKNKSIRGR